MRSSVLSLNVDASSTAVISVRKSGLINVSNVPYIGAAGWPQPKLEAVGR